MEDTDHESDPSDDEYESLEWDIGTDTEPWSFSQDPPIMGS